MIANQRHVIKHLFNRLVSQVSIPCLRPWLIFNSSWNAICFKKENLIIISHLSDSVWRALRCNVAADKSGNAMQVFYMRWHHPCNAIHILWHLTAKAVENSEEPAISTASFRGIYMHLLLLIILPYCNFVLLLEEECRLSHAYTSNISNHSMYLAIYARIIYEVISSLICWALCLFY